MSSPSPATPLPTRQQLDEIDALLRRMLTLPPMGEESASTAPPPAPTVFSSPPAPTIREFTPTQPAEPGEPRVQSWRVEWPQTPPPQPVSPPSVAAWGSPVLASPVEESVPWAFNPLASIPPPFAAAVVESPQPAVSPAPAVFKPAPAAPAKAVSSSPSLVIGLLVLLNGTFNILSYLLGPLGTWLRGPGRTAMGWVGVAMIIAAVVWTFGEWYGYDWPRPDLSRFGLNR